MLVKKEVLTLEKNKKVFESFQKGEIFTWMPIIGFDREAEDKGVAALIERMGFVPHGVSVFMFHPDIIHFHAGLEHEVAFPPDFCAYYANPYNEERRRQEWSNYDLKTLADKLNEAGTEAYLGIMGVDLENKFHQEWLSEHPEVKNHLRHAKCSLLVLKRMADGSYYEDFFADQVCRILADYGFAGLHVTDNFCPQGSTLYCGDFSRDMLESLPRIAALQFRKILRRMRRTVLKILTGGAIGYGKTVVQSGSAFTPGDGSNFGKRSAHVCTPLGKR